MTGMQERLFALRDTAYKDFHSKLMPTVNPGKVIGVRTPDIRKLARELAKKEDVQPFLDALPHEYYEEDNLHACLIEQCKDFESTIALLDAFLPYIDNWATCDLCSPKVLGKHLPELLPHVRRWMDSSHAYTIRYGVGMLMRWYLDDAFRPEYLEWAAAIRSEEYYVNMMIAWYFATALAKQPKAALPWLEQRRLEPWTHNKAIQKAIESSRISPEDKRYLRTLKVKTEPAARRS